MRLFALIGIILLGQTGVSVAQNLPRNARAGDAAVTYQWVRTNTQPGECGCFGLNGGELSGSFDLSEHWAAVANVSGGYESHGPSTGNSLTLVSYMLGGRFYFQQPWSGGSHVLRPFGEVLAGVAHAGGGIAGEGDHAYAFAGRVGGGLDLPVNSGFSVRVLQVDYYPTVFANGINHHQNNLSLGAGAVFHWHR